MAKREQFCFNCGELLGEFEAYGDLVSCGKPECEREACAQLKAERDEAHRQRDEDRGWSGW